MENQIILKQEDGRIFYDMPEDNSNPCLSCGACCEHYRISFYFGELDVNGGCVPSELTTKVNDFYACTIGTEYGRGRCVALTGNSSDCSISCAIYDKRPSPCREFPVYMEDGTINPECNKVRKLKGLKSL